MKPLLREQLKSLYVEPNLHTSVAVAAKLNREPMRELVERALKAELARLNITVNVSEPAEQAA